MDVNVQDEYQSITSLNDLVNIGDYTAVLMDGQYFVPTDTKSILFPDNETQYFINTGDILFNGTDDNTVFNDNEAFQLINTDNEEIDDQNQIIYYTKDATDMTDDGQILPKPEPIFLDSIEPSVKKIKIEGEFFDLNSLLDISGRNETGEDTEMNGFQYIVQLQNLDELQNIEDSKMDNIIEQAYNTSDIGVEKPPIDISKITGKNLLTGQTVTLESYLEKVRNSSKELTLQKAKAVSEIMSKKNEHTGLSNLLNKKLTIGKTSNGQRLIGKVIHVGKKDDDVNNEPNVIKNEEESILGQENNVLEESCTDLSVSYYDAVKNRVPSSVVIEDNQNQDANILMENLNDMLTSVKCEDAFETVQIEDPRIKPEEMTDKDNYQTMIEYVTKTMTNLMNMEAVLKKMKRKNLLIKVLERVIMDDQVKVNTFQVGGHLEMLGGWQRHEYEEKWIFKLDAEKRGDEMGEWMETWSQKFPETIKLTISVVKMNGLIQSTKVNLNYNLEKCSMCTKEFRSLYKLKTHLKQTHNVDYQYRCQICDRSLENKEIYDQHRKYHVDKNELFPCKECDKHFLSWQKLAKHMYTHSLDTLKLSCTLCGDSFDRISTWREHMSKHDLTNKSDKSFHNKLWSGCFNPDTNCHSKDVKNCYVCKVCNRTFSRYSNLQRHSEIHGTKKSIALYSCSMCGCTYNYISSLTRHVVQNHISAT